MSKNYNNIIGILDSAGISYMQIDHDISHTCDESKKYRLEKGMIGLGSKNIVFHCRGSFYLVVTHGDKQIKARNFKHVFGSKDIRFAYQDEITPLLDAVIGSIPPFGFENRGVKIFVDSEIFLHEHFIFNPSDPRKSIRIDTSDLKSIYAGSDNEIRYFIHEEEKFEIMDTI